MTGIITLTTDFGLNDGYVAIMHGVILGIAPEARIVDYTHNIPPQRIATAAFLLEMGYRYFPPGTVHVVVVDPGVGSERRAAALATGAGTFVGPDNGLLGAIAQAARAAGERVVAVQLTEPRFWLRHPGTTFHGRDIFAPVAAHLVNGVALEELGPLIDELQPLALPTTFRQGDRIRGEVIHIDHFGNCLTNITRRECEALGQALVAYVDQRSLPVVPTYSSVPAGQFCALFSSGDTLEIAQRDGNAAQAGELTLGSSVMVQPAHLASP